MREDLALAFPRRDAHRVRRKWYPDSWIVLLAAAFPFRHPTETVAIVAAFVSSHSGGAVPDSHRLPITTLTKRNDIPFGRWSQVILNFGFSSQISGEELVKK